MTEQPSTVLLTVEELQELGSELLEVMNLLEMTNLAIEGLECAQKYDQAVFLWTVKRFFTQSHAHNQRINSKLDNIAFKLLECHDAKELKGAKK